jgi:hypothetical protein
MSTKVLNLHDIIRPDNLGTRIAAKWMEWDSLRSPQKGMWAEIRRYVYATDTQSTTNALLPWKNTTTIPKLCQIADNLHANYMASMFPTRRWLEWEGNSKDEETRAKREAIKAYMMYSVNQKEFKNTVSQLIQDYILNGSCFSTPGWRDDRVEQGQRQQTGYVGPTLNRISPYDIVFNPTSPTFEESPKIIRSIVSMGDVKKMLEAFSGTEEARQTAEELWTYLKDVRESVRAYGGDLAVKDEFYQVDGFSSYQAYLCSDYMELLTFYGDLYDVDNDVYYKNHVFVVVDRHKVIHNAPHSSNFGYPPIFTVGWRPRPDNLWAMGPLDNLIGMQYRIDHIENLKADLFDLITFPPLKVSGFVEDFKWGPFERIYTGDEGDVQMMAPNTDPLKANFELRELENKMEEMAGAPKEAMGFRTPGEKTAYEVQRLENASNRIYQMKIVQFEENLLEPSMNGMLDEAQSQMDETTVRVFDDEFKLATFLHLTPSDIVGAGRIKPVAARHFVEKAQRVQTLTSFFGSAVGQDQGVLVHFSGIEIAKLMEELMDVENMQLVQPYIRLTEQAEGQRIALQHEEDTNQMLGQSAGMAQDDTSQMMGP